MSYVNIRLALNGKTITISIEEIHKYDCLPEFPRSLKHYALNYIRHSTSQNPLLNVYGILYNIENYTKQPLLNNACRAKKSQLTFYVKNKEDKELFTQTTSTFELSTTPHIALIWLAYISTVFRNEYHYVFLDQSIENFLAKENVTDEYPTLSMPLNYNFLENMKKLDFEFNTFIQKILSITEHNNDYEGTRETIRIMHDCFMASGGRFIETLSAENQDSLLFGNIGKNTLNITKPLSERISRLLCFMQVAIKEGHQNELAYIIYHINYMAKLNLYNPCLEKKAHDKKFYHFYYTEWFFIRDAEFKLLNDGRISIDVTQNTSYLDTYAPGCSLYGKLKDEMLFLAKIIGLEFDPETDFDKEIIFTPACSKELKNKGLHLNPSYMAKLMQQKNDSFSFFRQAYEFHGEEHESIFARKLPLEIAEMIFYQVSPELDNDGQKVACDQARNFRL